MSQREWHGCSNPAGHKFEEGVCQEADCGFDLRLADERIAHLSKRLALSVEATMRQEIMLLWAQKLALEKRIKVLESDLRELREVKKGESK